MNATTTAATATCPDWCVGTPELHATAEPLHRSGPMGMFECWQSGEGPITATLREGTTDSTDMTADELRRLVRDGRSTVRWIQSQQRGGESPSDEPQRSTGVGRLIRVLREGVGLTVEECAALLDLPVGGLQAIETGAIPATPALMACVATAIAERNG